MSARWIDGIDAQRARERLTLTYALTGRLRLGVEYNIKALEPRDRFGPLVNLRLVDETRHRPALILGTSSDRIGTEEGQAYYATVSKSLQPWIDLPVAPYVGASYNDRNYEWLAIAGLNYRLFDEFNVTHLWDGRNLHHTIDVGLGGVPAGEDPFLHHAAGLVVAEQDGDYFVGLSYRMTF